MGFWACRGQPARGPFCRTSLSGWRTLTVGQARRRFSHAEFGSDVCAKRRFGGPDAALHSALPVRVALALRIMLGTRRREPARGVLLVFLLGWAGTSRPTHSPQRRPLLWPLSGRRLRSPISYWEPGRHAHPFAFLEHAALLLVAAQALTRRL